MELLKPVISSVTKRRIAYWWMCGIQGPCLRALLKLFARVVMAACCWEMGDVTLGFILYWERRCCKWQDLLVLGECISPLKPSPCLPPPYRWKCCHSQLEQWKCPCHSQHASNAHMHIHTCEIERVRNENRLVSNLSETGLEEHSRNHRISMIV